MKIILLNGRIDGEKVDSLKERLSGVCGFRKIVLGYYSTEIIFTERSIKKATQIIEEECGKIIERIYEADQERIVKHLTQY